jgi:hypothetical protein
MNLCSWFRSPSSWLDSRLVGKSEVDGDGERERVGAEMVGDSDRERVWVSESKVGASSRPDEGSRMVVRSGREGETEREGGFRVGGRGDARELGGCPTCAENWPFFLRDGRDFGGMQFALFSCYRVEKEKEEKE